MARGGTEAMQTVRFARSAGGVPIGYAVHGSGPPLLIDACWLSHLQLDWQSPVWRHYLVELGRIATVVRYDERGHGLSDRGVTDHSLEARHQVAAAESTIWFGNRYAHARLGSFFHDGFNTPLLLQIAEERRSWMPQVLGPYPLRQLGVSRTTSTCRRVHDARRLRRGQPELLDHSGGVEPRSSTGGLVVYGSYAPSDWTFDMYSGRPDLIRPFLDQQHATSVTVPYRASRAVIFNSDLFHATGRSTLRFTDRRSRRRELAPGRLPHQRGSAPAASGVAVARVPGPPGRAVILSCRPDGP